MYLLGLADDLNLLEENKETIDNSKYQKTRTRSWEDWSRRKWGKNKNNMETQTDSDEEGFRVDNYVVFENTQSFKYRGVFFALIKYFKSKTRVRLWIHDYFLDQH